MDDLETVAPLGVSADERVLHLLETGAVGAPDLASLEQMQHAFVSRYPEWSDRLEIVHVGRATLQSFRTSPGSLAVISPGEPFHVRDERVAEWLQNWYLVREAGTCLYGADAAAIVPP